MTITPIILIRNQQSSIPPFLAPRTCADLRLVITPVYKYAYSVVGSSLEIDILYAVGNNNLISKRKLYDIIQSHNTSIQSYFTFLCYPLLNAKNNLCVLKVLLYDFTYLSIML